MTADVTNTGAIQAAGAVSSEHDATPSEATGAPDMAPCASDAAPEPAATAKGSYESDNYTEAYSYDVPRPFLTLQQAAAILGKSIRSIERSVTGRWGNKLPDGWVARKMKTSNGDEWRILPPPGFRVRQTSLSTEYSGTTPEPQQGAEPMNLFDPLAQRPKTPWRPDRHTLDQPTIVIDRTEEVEHLLRELVATQKALAEERRTHMEDLRLITQLQGSMRLLEVNANEQTRLKTELEQAKQELAQVKESYNEIVNSPWWKRLFGRKP